MKVKDGEKILVVRFSNMYGEDSIEKHNEVLKNKGYVYFGKFGSRVSQKHYKEVMACKHPRVLLISKDDAYICDLENIIYEKPNDGYPKYYDDNIFKKGHELSTYFKLKSFYILGRKNVGRFYVASSFSNLGEALKHSMTSMMLVVSNQDFNLDEEV